MTNEELFKLPRVRASRFIQHCRQTGEKLSLFRAMSWLSEEYEAEEPSPCPFCLSGTMVQESPSRRFYLHCNNPECGYQSIKQDSKEAAIVEHNELFATAVQGRVHSIREMHDQKVERGMQ